MFFSDKALIYRTRLLEKAFVNKKKKKKKVGIWMFYTGFALASLLRTTACRAVVAHAFNHSTQEAKAG